MYTYVDYTIGYTSKFSSREASRNHLFSGTWHLNNSPELKKKENEKGEPN